LLGRQISINTVALHWINALFGSKSPATPAQKRGDMGDTSELANVLSASMDLGEHLIDLGVTSEHLQTAVQPDKLRNLADYLKAGCPEISAESSKADTLLDGFKNAAVREFITSSKPPDVR
jgi:hypothetical protein